MGEARSIHRTARTLILACLFPVLLAAAWAAPRRDLTVKGSDTMVILMKRWAQAYSIPHPGLSIQVTGGGTGTGMAALINRTTDLCMASRPIRPDEIEAGIKAFRRRPLEIEVALDALVVFVHDSSPIRELSLGDLAALFTGRARNWRELGGADAPVVLYSRENSSGTYEFFKERVLEGADFSPRTQTMPGTAAVLAAVARDPHGIGYGGVAFAEGVRALALRRDAGSPAVLPTEPDVLSERYPIARALYVYLDPGLHRGPLAAFLGWIRDQPGQAIVREVGYFPLRTAHRSPAPLP